MKKICFVFFVCLFILNCNSATGKKPDTALQPTNLQWHFQTLPKNWENDVWVKGEDILYEQGMTLCSGSQQLKIRPTETLSQSGFSSGFLQSIGSGNVMAIPEIVGPVSIKIQYTGAGRDKIRYPIIKINGEVIANGEESPDTLTPKVLEVNYLLNIPAEVSVLSNNGVRFYDVIITPITIVHAKKITLDKEKVSLSVNERVIVSGEVFPENTSDKTLEWSLKKNTALEDENLGCVVVENPESLATSSVQLLGLRPGNAILQARSCYDKKVVAECKIEVASGSIENNVSEAEALHVMGNAQSVTGSIKLTDRPIGWANSAGAPESYGGYDASGSMKVFDNVSTYEELKNALTAAAEKRVIYITDTIDLNAHKTAYDYIVDCGFAQDFSSYEDYKQKFAATCVKDTESSMHAIQQALSKAQVNQARIVIPSNTTIIGTTASAGIINGEVNISGKENVVIRNLKLWNGYDFFPLWYQSGENNFNSIFDNITIDNAKWIWIDHCTIGEDAYSYDKVQTPVGELDWVTYDGALDIGKGSQFVTVSWCHFQNHDKTLLIGYGSNFTIDEGKLQVTLHHNYFENCTQRLPLVRHGTVHIFNNLYDSADKSGFCVGVGYKSRVYAENNVIRNGKYGFRRETLDCDELTMGKIYYTGNSDASKYYDPSKKAPLEFIDWNPKNDYNYDLDETDSLL